MRTCQIVDQLRDGSIPHCHDVWVKNRSDGNEALEDAEAKLPTTKRSVKHHQQSRDDLMRLWDVDAHGEVEQVVGGLRLTLRSRNAGNALCKKL